MKKVAYFPHQPSGCFWYRTEHPMRCLEENGIPTIAINLDEDIDIDNIQSFHMYGATPFSMAKILDYLKEQKIKIVYDIDDMLDLIDENNPNYYAVKKDLGSFNQMINYADEITVATPYIKEVLTKRTTTKITVLPNCYIPEEWNFQRIPHEEIRIGFAGSATHVSDLVDILPAIKNLQSKYNIKFYIMGFGHHTYDQWFRDYRYTSTEKGKIDLIKLDKHLKEIKFEWVPFVNYKLYPKVLTELSLDIGLCPLKDTPFNRCRSASKAMEYNLSGALVLSSHVEPYITEPTSITTFDWEKDLNYLVENYKLKYGRALHWLKEKRTMQSKFDILKSVYVVPM
jgi:O-antigen biosynthesis protein